MCLSAYNKVVFDALVKLLLLAVLCAIPFIIKAALQQRRYRMLRDNPPKRSVIEVSVPRGVTDSNKRMQEFYARIGSLAEPDDKMRKQGLGTVQVVYLVQHPPGRRQPEIRFLLYCDPDKMGNLKRFLKQKFGNNLAKVTIPKEDPMQDLMEKVDKHHEA